MLFHLQLLLFQFKEIAAFNVELPFIDPLQVLDGSEMIRFHFLHGFQILPILQVLLSPKVFISLLEVSDVQVLLPLDLLVLTLIFLLGFTQFKLDFTLVYVELMLELLLL